MDSIALQSSLRDVDSAYQKFFKEHSGYPKFKSKKTHRFFYKSKYVSGNIQYLNKHIKLPKLGLVKTKNKLVPQGRIVSATVWQEASDKYSVSLCCTEVEVTMLSATNKNIGIDLGIKDLLLQVTESKCLIRSIYNNHERNLQNYKENFLEKQKVVLLGTKQGFMLRDFKNI